MKMGPAAASPDAYVEALSGWQRERVEMLRAAVNAGAPFEEIIKWGNLVFVSNGLCILIRAEEARVLLGFWRGKRLAHLDPRIRPSGKYELANLIMTEDTPVDPNLVTQLAPRRQISTRSLAIRPTQARPNCPLLGKCRTVSET